MKILTHIARTLASRHARRRGRGRSSEAGGRTPGGPVKSEKGIAIIAVSTAVVFLAAMTVEFDTNTNVDAVAAANARDNVRAHFLARSAINLTHLMIRFQTDVLDRNRRQLGDIQFADFAPMFMSLFGGSPEEVAGYSALLGATAGEKIKGLGTSGGEFNVNISTEDAKINVNCAGGSESTRQTLKARLDALVFFDAFNPLFESPDAEGWQRDRAQQVTAILDYIDRDGAKFDAAGTPEDYGYETLDDKYRAKNNYIDSIGEIKLIRGVDDRFWTLFGDQLTVYGECRVNLAAVRDVKLLASIIYLSAKNPDDPVLRDANKLWTLASVVAEARNLGMAWDDLKQFSDFVKSPAGALGDLVGADPSASGGVDPLGGALSGLAEVEGVELDQQKLGQVAVVGPRRTYRVEATAYVGPVQRRFVKRITAIWDTQTVNQNPRDPQYGKGTWVFWKED